jgi:putative transposase
MVVADQRRQDRPGRVWHLDEIHVTIRGRRFWLWRAVDEHGVVLEEILQSRRDRKAAKRLLRKLLKAAGAPPKRIVTDKLGSYAAAKREIAPGLKHRAHKGLNNRAENSHVPFRSRERLMRGHRSPGARQRFVSMHSAVRNRFVPIARRRRSAQATRYHRLEAFDVWREAAGIDS